MGGGKKSGATARIVEENGNYGNFHFSGISAKGNAFDLTVNDKTTEATLKGTFGEVTGTIGFDDRENMFSVNGLVGQHYGVRITLSPENYAKLKKSYMPKSEKDIPGLAELEKAQSAMDYYYSERERRIARGDYRPLSKPDYDIKALKRKYPEASFYQEAESMAWKNNYRMSIIGERALYELNRGRNWKVVKKVFDRRVKRFNREENWD